MTVQEAKKHLENIYPKNQDKRGFLEECIDIAIECMEEVEQYRALGTVEELKEAKKLLEKLEELKFENEQPKTDWIPCEERLPSEKGFYLVTVKRGCNLEVLCIWYQKEYWLYYQEETGKIIAWQPLPQPYKKEGAENEK